jgi:transcriptional regulator with XRE-family HTH domain
MTADVTGDEREPAADQSRAPAAAQEQGLNPLQRLIQQRLRERGWSYGMVARRGGLPRSTVYTLAMTRNLVRPPRPATLDGLAKGLDVPVSAVRAAAAESTGLHYYDEVPAEQGEHPSDHERELLIASIDELTPEDRRHVAALVESLRKRTSPEPTDR